MIRVQKDHDHPPAILRSAHAHAAILQVLKAGQVLGFPRLDILMHRELLEALLEVYQGKCALTERKISLSDSTVFIAHYRPTRPYYWLCFEWSNLFPVSDDSTLFRQAGFPLRREEQRVLLPPDNRYEWRAGSDTLLAEEPLLIHPEYDQPEEFFYFDRDGIIHATEQHPRGLASIAHYTLNFGQVVVERKNKIRYFQRLLSEQVKNYKKVYVDTTPDAGSMEEFFVRPFEELVAAAQPDAEFSLLGQNMLTNFEYFFCESMTRLKDHRILRNAFQLFAAQTAQLPKSRVTATNILKTSQVSDARIAGLTIQHIKCFDQIDLTFDPTQNLHLLVGTSGTGKSTILQFLSLVLTGLPAPPTDYKWAHLLRQPHEEGRIRLLLQHAQGQGRFTFRANAQDGLTCQQHRSYYEQFRAQFPVLGYGLGRGSTLKGSHKTFSPIATLFGDSSFLLTLKDKETFYLVTEQFDHIRDLLNPILAEAGEGVALEDFDRKYFYFRTAIGRIRTQDMPRNFRIVFGYLLDMASHLHRFGYDLTKPETVKALMLFDELDVWMPLVWQRAFYLSLARLFPQAQIIAATQNPFVIQAMPHNDILLLRKEENGIKVEPFVQHGQIWAWTVTQVMVRLFNDVMEGSPLMDQKITHLQQLLREQETTQAEALREELLAALPTQSPYKAYLKGL
ncbi:MAG: AAA family ATPase [Bernardetiaceae bacterium]